MTKFIRITIFIVFIVCVISSYVAYEINLQERHAKSVRRLLTQRYQFELASVFEAFFKEYRKWPCKPGPIGFDCWNELLGLSSAKINNRHIDFFKQNNYLLMTEDGSGHGFIFRLAKTNNEMRVIIDIGN